MGCMILVVAAANVLWPQNMCCDHRTRSVATEHGLCPHKSSVAIPSRRVQLQIAVVTSMIAMSNTSSPDDFYVDDAEHCLGEVTVAVLLS